MKMRIQGNTIRFRLNRREVADFESGGRVEGFIQFPGDRRLTYALVKGGGEMAAAFEGAEIRISVPETVSAQWAGTDQVGLHARIPAGQSELEIVVEKDFQCMHKGEEGKDPDAYPNPMAAQGA